MQIIIDEISRNPYTVSIDCEGKKYESKLYILLQFDLSYEWKNVKLPQIILDWFKRSARLTVSYLGRSNANTTISNLTEAPFATLLLDDLIRNNKNLPNIYKSGLIPIECSLDCSRIKPNSSNIEFEIDIFNFDYINQITKNFGKKCFFMYFFV